MLSIAITTLSVLKLYSRGAEVLATLQSKLKQFLALMPLDDVRQAQAIANDTD